MGSHRDEDRPARQRLLTFVGLFAAVAAAGVALPPSRAAGGGEVADPTRALEQALDAVVLVVAEGPGGKLRYGAGVVVEGPGAILGSLHVVEGATRVGVLFHDAARVSYTPMDGGLRRLLDENPGALVGASVARADAEQDLVLLQARADTRRCPRLVPGPEESRVGEAVFALGHPGETAWSATSGRVSARRHGAIQHDAPLSGGHSGGPLVDARGRWLGVNTSKLVKGAEGVGFARPLCAAQPLLDAAKALPAVDGAIACGPQAQPRVTVRVTAFGAL